jgi:glycosyltransferase involved in cell wall biosynthesis
VIFVGELLEHLPRPTEFFNRVFQDYGGRNTFVCINVPYGPWESQEYRKTDPHREHLWHFSRGDIEKMFGRFSEYRLSCLPYGKSVSGEPMGNYLITFQSKGKKKADYPLTDPTLYMPRESVSLCMIVKDSEAVLKRCLDSVIGLVDEVIIGIDETTTDRTLEILQQYKKAHKDYIRFTEFDIRGCIFSGFDEARNTVIAKATCDWILWLDADEVLYGLNNLTKYLKPNQFAGYLIKQQHFSVEPPGVLRTDYPAKLFRRSPAVQFYGVVHEHPGTSSNEGVGNTAIIPDVVVKHDGYETESIRRLRFQRNVQLMVRDREKYPERTLGIFLWLRDISHMIKFELEQTNNRMTDDMVIKAKRGIELWEELQEHADIRMIADALEYYSNFVTVLGGGFEMSVGVSASKTNSTSASLGDKTKTARFLNQDHAAKYINKLFKHEVKHYESRYY